MRTIVTPLSSMPGLTKDSIYLDSLLRLLFSESI